MDLEKKKKLFHQKIKPQEILNKNSFGVNKKEAYYYTLKQRFSIQVNSYLNKTPGINLEDIEKQRLKIINDIQEDLFFYLPKMIKEELEVRIKAKHLKKQFTKFLDGNH